MAAMKTKLLHWTAALVAAVGLNACYTAYDAQGRPVQAVDPGAAAAGIAAAGLIGYAIADDRNDHYHGRHYYPPPPPPRAYRRGRW